MKQFILLFCLYLLIGCADYKRDNNDKIITYQVTIIDRGADLKYMSFGPQRYHGWYKYPYVIVELPDKKQSKIYYDGTGVFIGEIWEICVYDGHYKLYRKLNNV